MHFQGTPKVLCGKCTGRKADQKQTMQITKKCGAKCQTHCSLKVSCENTRQMHKVQK
jgi:hypothetical protein